MATDIRSLLDIVKKATDITEDQRNLMGVNMMMDYFVRIDNGRVIVDIENNVNVTNKKNKKLAKELNIKLNADIDKYEAMFNKLQFDYNFAKNTANIPLDNKSDYVKFAVDNIRFKEQIFNQLREQFGLPKAPPMPESQIIMIAGRMYDEAEKALETDHALQAKGPADRKVAQDTKSTTNTQQNDGNTPQNMRAYAKFKNENKLPPLWKQNQTPPSNEPESAISEASGFSTSRINDDGSSTSRINNDGSSTSRTLSTETTSDEDVTDFSQIRGAEQWEENLLALEKGEKSEGLKHYRGEGRKPIPNARDLAQEMTKREIEATEEQMNNLSERIYNVDKSKPRELRQVFDDATKCADKMKKLGMPGADEFKKSIDLAKESYRSELRRAAYADPKKGRSDLRGYSQEKTTEPPKPKPGR